MAHLPIHVAPEITNREPIILVFKLRYLTIPPGYWGSFTQALGPSQGPRYAPNTSGNVGSSTSPLKGGDDSDDVDIDTDQFIDNDDSW